MHPASHNKCNQGSDFPDVLNLGNVAGSDSDLADTARITERTLLRVLHLEDNPSDAELIHASLKSNGFNCHIAVAQKKSQFERAITVEKFDLIISDYALPDYDGISALQLAREKQPDTPFILVSGTLGEEQAVESLKSGATDYVLKTRLVRLPSAVRRALQETEARIHYRQAEQDLRAREESFRALTNNSPDSIARLDRDFRFVYCNPTLERSIGRKAVDLVGKTWCEAGLPPRPEWEEALLRVLQTGAEATIDFSIETPTGLRFLEARLVPEHGDDEKVRFVLAVTRDVTRIRGASEELRKRLVLQERLTKIAASVPGIIYAFRLRPDGSSCIPYASPTIEEFYGVRAEDLVDDASPVFNLIHSDDRREVQASIVESANTMSPWRYEFRVNHPRKGCFWIEGQSTPEREADGGILWHGFMSDITQRKWVEESLLQLSRAIEQSADNVIITDKEGIIQYANPAVLALTGYRKDEIIGQTPRVLKSIHHAPAFHENLWLRILAGNSFRGEFINRKKNGQTYCEEKTITPVFNEAGKITHFVATGRDITERKQIDEELRRKTALFEALVDSSLDGILVVNNQGEQIVQNEQFGKLLKIPSRIAGQRDDREQLEYVVNSTRFPERFLEKVTYLYAHPDETSMDEIEFKDGTVLDRYSAPVRGKDGNHYGRIWMFRDITERKRTEAEMATLNKDLVASSRQAGMAEVATNVLHNVGNVLNSVNVSATLIAERIRKSKAASLGRVAGLIQQHSDDLGAFITNNPQGKQLPAFIAQLAVHLAAEQNGTLVELDQLKKHVEHIKSIVSMQQSFAKVSGLSERINVIDLVEDALLINASSLNNHKIAVVKEFAPVPPITTQKHKALQILVNLVRNAQHACEASSRDDKQMTLCIMNGPDHVRVSVTDNGVGIPSENLTRIFNHGFTTKKDGHGFGLHSGAIAAKEMGGTLRVASPGRGQGATFTLELPVGVAEELS